MGTENNINNKKLFNRLNRSPKRLDINIARVKIPMPKGKDIPRFPTKFPLGAINKVRGSPMPKTIIKIKMIEKIMSVYKLIRP